MRESTTPASRRFSFKSTTKLDPPANRVVIPGAGTGGDPTPGGATGGGATITVYNSNGSGETTPPLPLPAAGWTLTSKGYRFKAAATTDPIQRVTIKADSIRVRGRGASFTYTLNEPSQTSIAVRLRLGSGTTWCANSPAKVGGTNDVTGKFVGQTKAPAPGVCPAEP
jgi:hypothetical protein